jgi:hypothetical protein
VATAIARRNCEIFLLPANLPASRQQFSSKGCQHSQQSRKGLFFQGFAQADYPVLTALTGFTVAKNPGVNSLTEGKSVTMRESF